MRNIIRDSGLVVLLLLTIMSIGCAGTRTRESAGEYVDDSVITTKVKSKILADQGLKGFQIDVETFKGVVLLSGFVDTKEQAQKAEDIAESVSDVREVKNGLVIKGDISTRESSVGEYVDDSVITTKVKSKILADEGLKGFQIDVETYKGVVLLIGFVDTKEQADRAEDIAKGVDGVREVKSNLVVKGNY